MGTRRQDELRVFRTMEHDCGYFDDRLAQDLVIDPHDPRLAQVFGQALAMGFRRSGGVVYRPDCDGCQACVAVRIDVDQFVADRSQRRCLARNVTIQTDVVDAKRTAEQFDLYRRYLQSRHHAGGMDDHNELDFDQFLTGEWTDTRFLEMRDDGVLIAVAVTDLVDDGLSAVYTFFDPKLAKRSLGSFAILRQIEWARELRKPYLYLGYWIDGHAKMDYKRRFSATEQLASNEWIPLNPVRSNDT